MPPTMAELPKDMPTLTLNDGTIIPMLGYGTGTAMWKKNDDGQVDRTRVEAIKTAIRLGYYHLDGAEVYNNELELGVAIKESGVPREKLFVTTKVHQGVKDIPAALDTSLKKLQLDYVDLYLIHAPFFAKTDEDLQTAWAAMEAQQAAGKVRSIGVSNYLQSHLEATLKTAAVIPSINQTEYHPYLQRGNLFQFQTTHAIAAAAYAPQTPVTKATPGPLDELLKGLAKKYYVGEGEVLLRWCLDQGIVAITTSNKEQRLSDYLRVLAFRLTPREVEEISEKGAEKHFRGFWKNNFEADDKS